MERVEDGEVSPYLTDERARGQAEPAGRSVLLLGRIDPEPLLLVAGGRESFL